MSPLLKPKQVALALLGSAILAFGLYHVHALSGVTEGGVLGLTLFFHHWLGVSPAWSGLVMNAACYLLGWRVLGGGFIACSAVAAFPCSTPFLSSFLPCGRALPAVPLRLRCWGQYLWVWAWGLRCGRAAPPEGTTLWP